MPRRAAFPWNAETPWRSVHGLPLQPNPGNCGVPPVIVQNLTRDTTLAVNAAIARTLPERSRGLLGRANLPAGEGLWLNPCSSIHTHEMQFPIDVVFLDLHAKVVQIHPKVKPGHQVRSFSAQSVLELPVGTIGTSQTQVGDRLKLTEQVQTARGVSKTVDLIALAIGCFCAFLILVSK